MTGRNKADRRANIARGRDSARKHPTPMLVDIDPGDGWWAWMVGDVMVVMPALLPGTPASIRRKYMNRVITNAVGECPRCGTVTNDGAVDQVSGLAHDGDCPVLSLERVVGPWLDRRAA